MVKNDSQGHASQLAHWLCANVCRKNGLHLPTKWLEKDIIMLTFLKLLPRQPPPCRIAALIVATDHLIPAVLYPCTSIENNHVWLA